MDVEVEGGVVEVKLTTRDVVAAALVAAVAIPYVGYLVDGAVPFIEDARGMSATGLVLGAVAFLVFRRGGESDRESDALSRLDRVLFAAAAVLGLVSLLAAESAAADVLLAAFMGSILAVFAIGLMEHAGLVREDGGAHRTAAG